MLGRYTLYNLYEQKIQPIFCFYALRRCSNASIDKSFPNFKKDTILKMLNYKSSSYISRFKISVKQAQALTSHREKHGLYKSVEDVLEVEGMTETILNEFLYSVMNAKQYKKGLAIKKSVIIPMIKNISKEKISTILGIYVGTNVVSWMLLGMEENVLEWNCESFFNVSENSTLNLLELAWRLNKKLPKSDIYVVDILIYDHHIAKCIQQLKPFLEKQQLRAMILAFLKNRNSDPEIEDKEYTRNLYLTNHNKVAELFGLQLGSEVISSAAIANKLLHDEENKNTAPSAGVYAPKNIIDVYRNQMNYIQDQMNWSLLTALTFLQLGIYEKHNCDYFKL